jgi:hypothetical protein
VLPRVSLLFPIVGFSTFCCPKLKKIIFRSYSGHIPDVFELWGNMFRNMIFGRHHMDTKLKNGHAAQSAQKAMVTAT